MKLTLENQSFSPPPSLYAYDTVGGRSTSLLALCLFSFCEQSFNLFLAAYHFNNQTFLPGPGSLPEALPSLCLTVRIHQQSLASMTASTNPEYKIRKPDLLPSESASLGALTP